MDSLRHGGRRAVFWSALIAAAIPGGCQERATGPVRIENRLGGPLTIAVAPALNVSGSADLDPNRAADLMASELSYLAGVKVIPVSRVLAVLADQNRGRVESPGHALEISRILGADAILVFAVTEYEAYEPPVVGIAAQLYGRLPGTRTVRFDPVAQSRAGSLAQGLPAESPLAPIAETEAVFDASHQWVAEEVERFAKLRSADRSAFGWRKYLASQQHYLRFCCHQTIRSLMGLEEEEEHGPSERETG